MASIATDLLGDMTCRRGLLFSQSIGDRKPHHKLTVKPPRATRMAARPGEAGSFLANECYGDGATADT